MVLLHRSTEASGRCEASAEATRREASGRGKGRSLLIYHADGEDTVALLPMNEALEERVLQTLSRYFEAGAASKARACRALRRQWQRTHNTASGTPWNVDITGGEKYPPSNQPTPNPRA